MNPYYTDYAEYMARFFPGEKIQKISVNAGFTCPNRDGTIGTGGCIYCSNTSFTPAYCFENESVKRQLEAGKRFFARKYPTMKYLAYFQSYTNTYGAEIEHLEKLYREAIEVEDIVALGVATRPDCLPDTVVKLLAKINQDVPVFVELGVETLHDETLSVINRGHNAAVTEESIHHLAEAGLHIGVHLIAGLPGETDDDVLDTVSRICDMPIESIKLHHLQLLRDTTLEAMYANGKIDVPVYTPESYIELCIRVIDTVPRHIAIERFLASAPKELLISPKWGLKNYEFTNMLLNRLKER